jgi:putative Ca2+/H+ antiporter (TMEM165/GDT1 family)
VWEGGPGFLVACAALAIAAGTTVLQRIPLCLLQSLPGALFLALARAVLLSLL